MLRGVRVHERVDDGLTYRHRRDIPPLLSTNPSDVRTVECVLLDERDRVFEDIGKVCPNVCAVEDATSVGPLKTVGLDPGIGKARFTLLSKVQHAPNSRNKAALMTGHQPESLRIRASKAANARQRF